MTCDYITLATTGVQGLHPYQAGKPIEELEREYGVSNAIKLASNENPLGASPLVTQALQSGFKDLTRYPDSNGFALKKSIAALHHVEMDTITLGNGSNDILELIARAYLTSNDSVVYSEHAFVVYPLVTQAVGAKHIVTPAKNWGHDLEAMQAAICEDTRLVFIANPNNPTGTWLKSAELKQFLDNVPEEILVVIDEAYAEYVEEDDYPNCIEWLSEYPNLIITRTFSKAYGLASLRMGYAIANKAITNILNRVRQPFNGNSFALLAAEAALADQDFLAESIRVNKEGMTYLTQQFDEMQLSYIPSVGNFISVNVGRTGGEVYEELLHEGVIVRPVANYKMPNYLRITIGLPEENQRLIAALQKVLAKLTA